MRNKTRTVLTTIAALFTVSYFPFFAPINTSVAGSPEHFLSWMSSGLGALALGFMLGQYLDFLRKEYWG